MAHNNTAQGFYVFQSTLGAPLEFHPALGTAELDEMIDNYVLGFAPIQDKRATISLDFLEQLSLTGETIKFYPVSVLSFTSATSSPASMQDSGYGSSFSASPMAPTWNWGQVAQAPSTSFSSSQSHLQARRQSAASSRNSTIAAARSRTSDFSHLPGMKILTKDGRDVTNAAARGSKTKEQRDHAHLMRIIKACDSCRAKKIRCDPSHKARETLKSRSQESPRHLDSTRHASRKQQSRAPNPVLDGHSLAPAAPFTELPVQDLAMFDNANMAGWEDLVNLDQNIPPPTVPDDYDWFNDPKGLFFPVPNSVSSSSSTPASQPFTPTSEESSSVSVSLWESLVDGVPVSPSEASTRPPRLPYLDDGSLPHEYIDFNLYSPASSLADGDLPVFAGDLSSHCPSGDAHRHRPHSPSEDVHRHIPHSPSGDVHRHIPHCPEDGCCSCLISPARQSSRRPTFRHSPSQTVSESSLFSSTQTNSASQMHATPKLHDAPASRHSSLLQASVVQDNTSQFKSEMVGESCVRTDNHHGTSAHGRSSMSCAPEVSAATRHSDIENGQGASQDIMTRTETAMAAATAAAVDPTRRGSRSRHSAVLGSDVNQLPNALRPQAVSSASLAFEDGSRHSVHSLSCDLSPAASIRGDNQHSILMPLQLLAMACIASICLRGEKSYLTRTYWTKTLPSFLSFFASALAVGILLHAIAAPGLLWSDMLGFKESLPGLAFCVIGVATSRSVKTVCESEAVGQIPRGIRGTREGEGVADDGDH